MGSFLIIAIILALICAYGYYREVQAKKEAEEDHFYAQLMANKENQENENNNNNDSKPMGTRDFLIGLLTKMGCQYEIDEKERINFKWQGGHFTADAQNDCAFVLVWYLYWAEYELYDIDTLARVKRALNEANINYNINVVYSLNEAGSTFHVHSKKHFLLIPQIPDAEGYLECILGMFFDGRRYVETLIDRYKMEEEKTV